LKTIPNFRRNIANIAFATDMDRLFARIAAPKGIILALHRLRAEGGDDPLGGLNVGLDEFRQCLDLLGSSGYEIVSMTEAMARLDRPGMKAKFAVLTFDDGYRDNYSLLLPELTARKVPALIYLTTGFIDRTASMWWYGIDALLRKHGAIAFNGEEIDDFAALNDTIIATDTKDLARLLGVVEKRYGIDFRDFAERHAMDWAMVREAADSGLIEIGSHGVSHMPLSRLSPHLVKQEMQLSAARIVEQIGRPATHFAYPYGDRPSVSQREIALARECGFVTAATSIPGLVRSNRINRHALRRIVLGGTGMVERLRAALSGVVGEAPIAGPA
jgi:peptidoglycan/xylan/chitin deacetylase (PgdA/CDA1 family)